MALILLCNAARLKCENYGQFLPVNADQLRYAGWVLPCYLVQFGIESYAISYAHHISQNLIGYFPWNGKSEMALEQGVQS